MADRILVLSKGAVMAEFAGRRATEEELVDASAAGHGPAAAANRASGPASNDDRGDPVTASAQTVRPRSMTRTEVAQFLLRGRALIALVVLVVVLHASWRAPS